MSIQSTWENMLAEPVIDVRRVKIECPACGKEQYVKLRVDSLVSKNGVVSLVIKAACDHEFNLYLDSHFQVRSYERIDAVVSAEMLQVDQEISDFMKDEGIQERASGKFVGKLRNDIDRDRHLETIIRYFRGADVAGSYWISAIGGHRPEPPKFEPTKAFPLPPLPSFPAPPVTGLPPAGTPLPPGPPKIPVAAPESVTSPVTAATTFPPLPFKEAPLAAAPAGTPPSIAAPAKVRSRLTALPSPATKVFTSPSPEPTPVPAVTSMPAPVVATEPPCGIEAVMVANVQVEKMTVEAAPEPDVSTPTSQPESPEVPEITLEDLRAQFEARVKKINDLMIKLELENLNESVSDVALVKKKAKLSKLKDDLEVQFNKIVMERGLNKNESSKVATSSA